MPTPRPSPAFPVSTCRSACASAAGRSGSGASCAGTRRCADDTAEGFAEHRRMAQEQALEMARDGQQAVLEVHPHLRPVRRGVPGAPRADETAAQELSATDRARQRREELRNAGLCIDCKAPSPEHVRCETCRDRISVNEKRRRNLAWLGAHIEPRLAEAAERGVGIRLTASDVAEILQARA